MVYYNSKNNEEKLPEIHETYKIGSLEKYRTLILKASEKCGVLIYANGTEYESLKEESNVECVTDDTSHPRLEKMDTK